MKNNNRKKTKNILVIDDDESICKMLKNILLTTKHHVETYTDSNKAIQRFEKYPFDLVTTDLQMPDNSGWLIAKRVKEKNPLIPVVLITGSMINNDEIDAIESGVDYVILKPFGFNDILDVVNIALNF